MRGHAASAEIGFRPERTILLAMIGAVVAVTVVGWSLALVVQFQWFRSSFDIDYGIYMHAVDHWLATGEWYADRQLHGPYPIELGDVLYPPDLLYLLVPFRLLGPAPWTFIPMVLIAGVVVRHRPALWAWLLISLCLAWPVTPAKFVFGNPVIWLTAAVALGTRYSWPSALVLIKPTVIPFALLGIRDRRWWLVVLVMGLLSLPFLADTLRYIPVLLDAETNPIDGRGGPLYRSRSSRSC